MATDSTDEMILADVVELDKVVDVAEETGEIEALMIVKEIEAAVVEDSTTSVIAMMMIVEDVGTTGATITEVLKTAVPVVMAVVSKENLIIMEEVVVVEIDFLIVIIIVAVRVAIDSQNKIGLITNVTDSDVMSHEE